MKRVVVAMSGGVDSSVAAWLLKDKGYEVIGATMCIGSMERTASGRCCSVADIEDARRVALQLGIPYFVFDLRDEFKRNVVEYFCREYERGRTPNPCILCNEAMKFGSFLNKAFEMGADGIATGHYARLSLDERSGRTLLRRGIDETKDQSYVLFSMTQDQLRCTLFPLGDYRKEEVRRKALEIGLRVHDKPDSQEVCFIQDKSYHSFLQERTEGPVRPGPILDNRGNVLGTHRGIAFYTIGQRRGLGLARRVPSYVVHIDPERNTLLVGGEDELYGAGCTVDSVNWIVLPDLPRNAEVKIRYRHSGSEAALFPKGKSIEVRFKVPQRAITPGQAAVFYEGDTVLGGGWIRGVGEVAPEMQGGHEANGLCPESEIR